MDASKPSNMSKAYELSYRKACGALMDSDLGEISRRTGAVQNGGTLRVAYFGSRVEIQVSEPEPQFTPQDLPLAEKILILHYLTGPGADRGLPRPESDRLVSFKNLPGAAFYGVPYQNRGPGRIARRFGTSPEEFRRAGSALGWTPEAMGDLAFSFQVLPRIRGVVVLHLGDEELPAEAGILHNQAIVSYLPLEDVAVLGGLIATRLTRAP